MSGAKARLPRHLEDPFLLAHAERLEAAGDDPLAWDDKVWDHKAKDVVGIDVECYVNFFVVCFKRFSDGTRLAFEMSRRVAYNARAVEYVLRKNLTVGFNSRSYDLIMICLAAAGADTVKLKQISDEIILGELRPWDAERKYNLRIPPAWDHIDLQEPNPSVRQGLKMLHGRLHGRFLTDLPYPPAATLTPRQMNHVTLYCHNDLDMTQGVWEAMKEPMALRVALTERYRTDMRSRSDSQIGETIVKRRVEELTRTRLARPSVGASKFNYTPPAFIRFDDARLRSILAALPEVVFRVDGAGEITTPSFLAGLEVSLGRGNYAMGIGGLHSTESHRALRSDERAQLIDVDVASQYPSIIMQLGLYPPAVGPKFLEVYGALREERLAAKAAGDKVGADSGRIALNGVYGKLGSPYSVLYAPHLVIAITLTGQLSILMLIERAELAGIPVVSANTDGVVFHCPRQKLDELEAILARWEADTGFTIEKTPYQAIYNSSVNTYIALKEGGAAKRKGFISNPWGEGDLRGQMMKNPQMTICSDAVLRWVRDNVPIEETIRTCRDPRAFLTVVKVASGGVWRGFPLGRAVRYYWSVDGEPIRYSGSGNKVGKTDGARPLLELTDELPPDLDYLRYCQEAARLATELGVRP